MSDTLDYIAEGLRPLAVPIELLEEDPENVRIHDDKGLSFIAESLQKFKQTKNIVGVKSPDAPGHIRIKAGNGLLRVAKQLGWTHVAVLVREDWDDLDSNAYAIADNRLAELSFWDYGVLTESLEGMLNTDEDLVNVLGFTEDEISDLGAYVFDEAEDFTPVEESNKMRGTPDGDWERIWVPNEYRPAWDKLKSMAGNKRNALCVILIQAVLDSGILEDTEELGGAL